MYDNFCYTCFFYENGGVMKLDFAFFALSIGLGIGLAMDAFSVSLADGLKEPKMKKTKLIGIAAIFAFFQAMMPLIGWICIHTVIHYFQAFEKFIPWIALILLLYIGGKMLIEGIKHRNANEEITKKLTIGVLFVQGIATSIDALSVGFSIAEYNFLMAFICAMIIAIVTFAICVIGLLLGKAFGTKFSNKAEIIGGVILIIIGIEIFISGIIK